LKKLEAFLDSLEVETHFPSKVPRRGVYASVANPAIEQKMDKYDIFKQDEYQNIGTKEFPLWARKTEFQFGFSGFKDMPDVPGSAWPSYAGINRASYYMYGTWPMTPPRAYSPWWDDSPKEPPLPVETPHQKLQKKIASLQSVAPAKIENPNPAPPIPARSPDYVGTITAWRGWGVDAGKLVALGCDHVWEPKEKERAKCREDNTHPAPKLDCSCGFWSFRTLDLLTQALSGYLEEVVVVGTVEIWGRVIECENGFRSEYAYPKELWTLDEGMEHLSWTYGVPVRKYVQPCTALVPYRKMK
jgi:hypothetical protein